MREWWIWQRKLYPNESDNKYDNSFPVIEKRHYDTLLAAAMEMRESLDYAIATLNYWDEFQDTSKMTEGLPKVFGAIAKFDSVVKDLGELHVGKK